MHVDETVLADLGILYTGNVGEELFSRLDFTASAGGRERLLACFRSPLSSDAAIRDRQRMLGVLDAALRDLNWKTLGESLDRVERLLNRGYVALPRKRFTSLWVRWHYSDMVKEIGAGLVALHQVVRAADAIIRAFTDRTQDSPDLESRLTTIADCLDDVRLAALRGLIDDVTILRNVSPIDHLVRGTGEDYLRTLIGELHDLDALYSLARIARLPGFSYPHMAPAAEQTFRAEGAFHPLLARPVRSAISLGNEKPLALITGPNMAGKTTFLRTCGIVVYLAHLGAAVPASFARVSLFDRLFTSVIVRDSIARGESYFLAEVRAVRTLLTSLTRGERVFAIADEMFRGTNVSDAESATDLVVRGLAECQCGVFMVATHLLELARRLGDQAGIEPRYFSGEPRADGTLSFDYGLRSGTSSQHLGMLVLEQEGIPELLAKLAPVLPQDATQVVGTR